MNNSNFFKITLLIMAVFTFSVSLHAQHLFSVNYNAVPDENVAQLRMQLAGTEVSTLSLTKSNDRNVYPVAISSENARIVILNEETGANVVVTPASESLTEFLLAPFFIEELRQSVLGEAHRYLIVKTNSDFSVENVASVSADRANVLIPRYFYGPKENVQEALPQDRQILHIFKERPHLHPASDDPETLRQVRELEEAMSYYVYMFRLTDGTLTIYDENFNNYDEEEFDRSVTYPGGGYLPFNLSGLGGASDAARRTATLYALELWSEQLSGTIPVDMNVGTSNLGPDVIGASYRQQQFLDTETNTWMPSALWNQMVGYDATTSRDIRIVMNSQFSFYYELDADPSGDRTDWVTVMLHEVSHGLGYFAICGSDGKFSYTTAGGGSMDTDYPGTFDRQLFRGLTDENIVDLTVAERKALVISGNLFSGAPGSDLLAANNNTRVRMYAPNPYASGSSVSHWNTSISNFSTWMKPHIASNTALHTFNTRKIGIFRDMGWQTVDYTNGVTVTFMANDGTTMKLVQDFLPGVAKNLRANTFTWAGYTFTGWNTAADGSGTAYAERASMNISNNMTLYAQWKADTFTLTFNPIEGTVSPTSKQVTFEVPIGELPIPVRAGYRFLNWKIGVNPIDEETVWRYFENMTARAEWEKLGIIDGQREASLQIVPNPASNIIELRIMNYELQVEKIEFYNIFGQLVKSVPFDGQTIKDGITQKIDISDMNAGVYMVKAGDKTVKLVVN